MQVNPNFQYQSYALAGTPLYNTRHWILELAVSCVSRFHRTCLTSHHLSITGSNNFTEDLFSRGKLVWFSQSVVFELVPPALLPYLHLLYPKGAEAGSCCRPSGCLVSGSIRTLKNYFKSTSRM